jgi:hypothetical protein
MLKLKVLVERSSIVKFSADFKARPPRRIRWLASMEQQATQPQELIPLARRREDPRFAI